jgi:hypothetical protein
MIPFKETTLKEVVHGDYELPQLLELAEEASKKLP